MNAFSNILGTFSSNLPEGYTWLAPILDFIESALLPIMIVLIAVSAIYAIILGVKMARAESAEQRDEAKKRIVNFLVGAAVIVVLLIILYVLAANITSIIGSSDGSGLVDQYSKSTSSMIGLL